MAVRTFDLLEDLPAALCLFAQGRFITGSEFIPGRVTARDGALVGGNRHHDVFSSRLPAKYFLKLRAIAGKGVESTDNLRLFILGPHVAALPGRHRLFL